LEKLRTLHDDIKNHPWRINNNSNPVYLADYRKLLYDFLDTFYQESKKTIYYEKFRNGGFYHDFRRAIGYIGEEHNWWAIDHVDRCIQYIHMFLNTGKFNKYATFYDGCHNYKSAYSLRIYEWDDIKQNYFPIYKKDELDNIIKEIEEYKTTNGKFADRGLYSEIFYNNYVSFKENFYYKLID
jgi:hypothetical protein